MATLPFAVEAGSAAAGYTGGVAQSCRPQAHRPRPERDMPRKRIEGPDVPQARAVLVPLCHDSRTKVPHALFTVKPDDFGAPHAGFPLGPGGHNDDSDDIAAAVREHPGAGPRRRRQLAHLGRRFRRGGRAQAVRGDPRGGLPRGAGRRGDDVDERAGGDTQAHADGGSADDLLSKESVDVTLVPGVGPRCVQRGRRGGGKRRRRGCRPKIWGLSAQILHQVMRVVVGPRKEQGGGAVRAICQQEVRRRKLKPVT